MKHLRNYGIPNTHHQHQIGACATARYASLLGIIFVDEPDTSSSI